jgi:hypothetical protein
MVDFTFGINRDCVAAHIAYVALGDSKRNMYEGGPVSYPWPEEELVAFMELARRKHPDFLMNVSSYDVREGPIRAVWKSDIEVPPDLVSTQDFSRIMGAVEEYRDHVMREWVDRRDEVNWHLSDITFNHFPERMLALMSHPSVICGTYMGDGIFISGCERGTESMLNLVHEAMHHERYFGYWDDVSHAVIELAVDHELGARLGDDRDYGRDRDDFRGHQRLNGIKWVLMPRWRRFLQEDWEHGIFNFLYEAHEAVEGATSQGPQSREEPVIFQPI